MKKSIFLILITSCVAHAKDCNDIAISVQRSFDLYVDSRPALLDSCQQGALVKEAGGDLKHFEENIDGFSRAQAENLGLDADDNGLGKNYAAAIKEAGMLGYKFGTY